MTRTLRLPRLSLDAPRWLVSATPRSVRADRPRAGAQLRRPPGDAVARGSRGPSPASAELPPAASRRPPPAARRLAGLDGLRAIAIGAVVVFHLDPSLLRGGFLGVDLFFAISGFLITRMLLTEVESAGAIRLRRFYWRRARRLMPAMIVTVLAIVIAAQTVWYDQLTTLAGGVLSSLGYVTNWWLILDHQSYFVSSGRPPMTQHLWSLAVEEQFYIVWSLLLVGVAWCCRRSIRLGGPGRAPRIAGRLAVALAIASAAGMALLAVRSDLPYGGSTSRAYFGTDTHSCALLLGAAAGAWLITRTSSQRRPDTHWASVAAFDAIGALALLGIIVQFVRTSEFSPALYRGGFLGFGVLAVIVVLAVTRNGSVLGAALSVPVLRWIGLRSYSIYLWHWPVIVVTRPGVDLSGPPWLLNIARTGVVVGLAALSYKYVEEPLRAGGRRPVRRRPGARLRSGRRLVLGIGALVSAALLCVAASPVSALLDGGTTADAAPLRSALPASSAAAALPASSAAAAGSPSEAPASPSSSAVPSAPASAATTASAAPPASAAAPAPPASAAAPAPPPIPPRPQISAFGDSVILGSATALSGLADRLDMDAVEGVQAYKVLGDVQSAAQAGALATCVVIHTGNNGIISPSQLSTTLAGLIGHRVVLLNDRVPRDWQDPNNATLAAAAAQFSNVTLLDWYAASNGQPWLYRDGLHLTQDGAGAYAQLVVSACSG